MANMNITNVDLGSVIYCDAVHEADTLNFAGTATYKEGTIVGRLTANGRLHPFTIGASDGSQTPIGVLTTEYSRTGSGTLPCRALITGKVRKERLVVHADGGPANLTQVHIDTLRDYGIVVLSVRDLSVLDNQ